MLPPKKKARQEEGPSSQSKDVSSLLSTHVASVTGMIDTLDAIESASPSDLSSLLLRASSHFLVLKSAQRRLCLSIESKSATVREKRQAVESKSLALQNLVYERDYLLRQIRVCRDYETEHLEKMCREELGEEENEEKSEGQRKSGEEAMDLFLRSGSSHDSDGEESSSYRDPSHHSAIISKLHDELTLRGKLDSEYQKLQGQLTELQKSCQEKKQFLADFPKRIAEMERASLGLQNFFLGSKVRSKDSALAFVGTERSERLVKARELSSPLYTLFVQVQSYLDAFDNSGMELAVSNKKTEGGAGSAAVFVDQKDDIFQSDGHAVLLNLPVPELSVGPNDTSGRKKKEGSGRVTLRFEYLPKMNVVTADVAVSSNCTEVDVKTLLVNLFPGDTGALSPNGANWFQDQEKKEDPNDEEEEGNTSVSVEEMSKKMSGKPYHWCNYIAGMRFPLPPTAGSNENPVNEKQEQRIESSTKAVMRQLTRRIRSHVTLHHFLTVFEKRKPNPIPIHPAMDDARVGRGSSNSGSGKKSDNTGTALPSKLVGWTEITKSSELPSGCRSYLAIIKRKSSTLRATVTIDPMYPDVPPVWSLQPAAGELSWGEKHGSVSALQSGRTTPLYDGGLGRIEDRVNADYGNLVLEEVEETYDWLVSHQLRELVECWDELQCGVAANDGIGGGGGGERVRRGRDRRGLSIGRGNTF